MTSTDYLRLSEHKIFKAVRDTLPANLRKTQNVLIIKDDVLFTWDFQSNCVLTLNVKTARSREGDNVAYQTLLPTSPPLFTPELLVANDEGTLLAVAGPNGVLVLELPRKCPPYGAFSNNKELVYCRSHSLDERLLACNDHVEVRQVKFHPASVRDTHVVVLTSDNVIRLYNIDNSVATSVGAYPVGVQPTGYMPGSKLPFLGLLGETAVDFDFGPPEAVDDKFTVSKHTQTATVTLAEVENVQRDISDLKLVRQGDVSIVRGAKQSFVVKEHKLIPKVFSPPKPFEKANTRSSRWNKLKWPIYVLRGDGSVYVLTLYLYEKIKPDLKGPIPMIPASADSYEENYCTILCLKSTPSVLCISRNSGTISHCLMLPSEEDIDTTFLFKDDLSSVKSADRSLYVFESLELELGLTMAEEKDFSCPIFLHRDESNSNRYFATHETGIHSITVPAIDDLQKFVNSKDDEDPLVDLLTNPSVAEYLICTKTLSSSDKNPVIGFSVYHEPTSVVSLLANGQLVSLALLTNTFLPAIEDLGEHAIEEMNSPLKKMLREPFDSYIQKILKQVHSQPILKLSSAKESSPQENYELLQRAAKVFREEYFKYYDKAREELEKRVKALQMLKTYQQEQIEKMTGEKLEIQQKAESLAEKYEDIKDKQDELSKRCEKLLIMVSQKKLEPSDAEKEFFKELQNAEEKVQRYTNSIEKLKTKKKYQEIHMENWKQQHSKKITALNPIQSNTIKTNLQDVTNKITQLIKDVKEYKQILNLNNST